MSRGVQLIQEHFPKDEKSSREGGARVRRICESEAIVLQGVPLFTW